MLQLTIRREREENLEDKNGKMASVNVVNHLSRRQLDMSV